MIRDENGDKCFESHTEAMFLVGEWVAGLRRYVLQLRDEYGAQLPMFRGFQTQLNDLLNVTRRYIAENKRREEYLQAKIHELSDSHLCPRCQKPKGGGSE